MSILQPTAAPCPQCGTENTIAVVSSLNADRRPDLRQAVLDGTFQSAKCGKCDEAFRVQPNFSYIDSARRQWILAHPADQVERWRELEDRAREVFDTGYGAGAPRIARDLGATMTARITFGWPALREKLVAAEAGIADTDLELLKLALLRQVPNPPLADQTELRLDRAEDDVLVLAWLDRDTEAVQRSLRVPRATLAEIAEDPAGWAAPRAELTDALFVDLDRMLVTS
jgi:hypothetical protein